MKADYHLAALQLLANGDKAAVGMINVLSDRFKEMLATTDETNDERLKRVFSLPTATRNLLIELTAFCACCHEDRQVQRFAWLSNHQKSVEHVEHLALCAVAGIGAVRAMPDIGQARTIQIANYLMSQGHRLHGWNYALGSEKVGRTQSDLFRAPRTQLLGSILEKRYLEQRELLERDHFFTNYRFRSWAVGWTRGEMAKRSKDEQ